MVGDGGNNDGDDDTEEDEEDGGDDDVDCTGLLSLLCVPSTTLGAVCREEQRESLPPFPQYGMEQTHPKVTAGQGKCSGLAKGIWAAGLGSSAPLLPTWDLERERRHGRAVAPLSGSLHGKASMQGVSGGQGTVYQKAVMAPFSSLEARLQHSV